MRPGPGFRADVCLAFILPRHWAGSVSTRHGTGVKQGVNEAWHAG